MEKGLLIDTGRKFWSVQFLESVLELMGDLGMTHLQLHFSENTGFRLEYPELALDSELDGGRYSKADMTHLVEFAAARGIEIVPSFDSPGHLGGILENFPDFALTKKDGTKDFTALDVTNPEACDFIINIYKTLAQLFPAKLFHIGGDEFIPFNQVDDYPALSGKLDAYVNYVNRLADTLTAAGKTCRVWNDGFFRHSPETQSTLTDQVEVCYWTNWDKNMADVHTWLDKQYTVINFCDNYLYYVLGENAGYSYPTAEKLEEWSPDLFSGGQRLTADEMPQLKGCYFSVWSDIPEAKAEEAVLEDLKQLLPVYVKKINENENEKEAHDF
ncbi:family 20 glycosylhydrolase [Lactovum odontotermitis]